MTDPRVRTPNRVPPGSSVGAGRFAQVALFTFVGVELVSLLTAVVTLLRWNDRQIELSSAETFFADGWEFGLGFAYFGFFLISGIAWLIWQFQAHSNLSTLTATRFRPAAAFWILVPIASLFLPYQAIRELAKAGVDRPVLRRWWWALYLSMNVFIGVASGLSVSGYLLESTAVRAAAAMAGMGAALGAIRLISLINTGLETRRMSAGWSAGPPALSRRAGVIWSGTGLLVTVLGAATFALLLPAAIRSLPGLPETNFAFTVGGCFNEAENEYVDISCNSPHEAEVYRVLDYPDAAVYPGDDLITQWAEPQCYARFEAYTGVPYQDSALEFNYLYPSAQGWRSGDREVICYLFDPSGDDLTEPIARAT